MIKLVVFDLDGVLVSTKELHFKALNLALEKVNTNLQILWNEHLDIYDGLPTKEKLTILTKNKGLEQNLHDSIWLEKQKITGNLLNNLSIRNDLIEIINNLKAINIKVYIATNSIRNTTELILKEIGILDLVDGIITNEDVIKCKPSSEIYLKCIISANCEPYETLILEDSVKGLSSAIYSGSNILTIKNIKDVTHENIFMEILKYQNQKNQVPWIDYKLNIVIPMAGMGTRFFNAGYKLPKPLIEVNGKPMIQIVVENLNIKANYIFIVQKSHYDNYNLNYLLNLIAPNCKIIKIEGITEGAACTTLLAKEFVDSENPLMIVNSDQYIEWNSSDFLYQMINKNSDAGIVTFPSSESKWSYAKTDTDGYVTEVAEKNPISNKATVGIYYWKNGSCYVRNAEKMISENIRVNNEFYVCPVFNQAIKESKKVICFDISKDDMHGLGTPEDLEKFINRK